MTMVEPLGGASDKERANLIKKPAPVEKVRDRRSRSEEESGLPQSDALETKYDPETGLPLDPEPKFSPEALAALEKARKKVDEAFDKNTSET